jgi:hypothetical protein
MVLRWWGLMACVSGNIFEGGGITFIMYGFGMIFGVEISR